MSGSSAAVPRGMVPRGLNLLKDGRESDNGKRAAGLEGPGSARLWGSWGHGDVGDLGPVIADITFAPTAKNFYLALEDDVDMNQSSNQLAMSISIAIPKKVT